MALFDIKIIVATHKKYWMPTDKIYLPLHVGQNAKQDIGFVGDNTGDNISDKNYCYCELTGLYWAWKNIAADVVGLVHYRRYFTARSFWKRLGRNKKDCVLRGREAERILHNCDVIVPKKRRYFVETNKSHYSHAHNEADLQKAERILLQNHPECADACQTVMQNTSAYMFNMFIMKRPYFESYCQWLFPMMEELEQQLDLSDYSAYQARVIGYVSELLFNVWLEQTRPSYLELPVMFMEKQNWVDKGGRFLTRKFSGGPFRQTAAG